MVWQNNASNLVAPLKIQTTTQSLAANSNNVIVNKLNVALYQSYDIALSFVDASQGTVGHALTQEVVLEWFDDLTSNVVVFREVWHPWVVTTVPANTQGIIGSGPMHGQYMSVTVNNNFGFAVTLQYFNLFGSARNVQISDWRQNHGNHITDSSASGINSVGIGGYDNSLFDTGLTDPVLASATGYFAPLFLYAGPITLNIFLNTVTITNLQIVDVGSSSATSGQINGTGAIAIWTNSALTNASQSFSINLPRNACAIRVSVGATGTGSIRIKAVAQQGP